MRSLSSVATLIAVLLIDLAAKYQLAITSAANNAPALVITTADAASISASE